MKTRQLINLKNTFNTENFLATKAVNDAAISSSEIRDAIHNRKNNMECKLDADVLIDYIIKTHHAFATKNTVIIYNLMQKVAYRHSEKHNELKKFSEVAFLFFHGLLNQMLKEEQTVFPYVRQAINAIKQHEKNNSFIRRCLKENLQLQQAEHQKCFEYLKAFREITHDYEIPPDACSYYISLFEKMRELERDLIIHFYLEDNILYSLCDGNNK